jgi:putative aldouronate transport system substrate-binding protein
MNWGEKDNTYTTDSNGWPVLTTKLTSDSDGLSVATAITKYTRKNGPVPSDYYNRLILGTVSKGPGLKALETWRSAANGSIPSNFPLVTQTSAESAEVSSLTTNIETYANECYIKFIDGSMSLDSDWDTYVKTIEGMDLAKLTSLKQAALDRYNKR